VLRLEERAIPGSAWQIIGEGQDRWTADALVLTCPAHAQAQMLGELDRHLAEQIAGIGYNRIAVIALGYQQADVPPPLDGFGFIVPQRSRRDILGVQWCSSIYSDRAPPGHVLLRVMSGGWNRPEVVSWDDKRLLQAVQAELRLTMGITAAPVFHHIVRWDRAIPQYHLGHLDRVAAIETAAAAHPGLFLGGNAYRGIALNDCTEQAELLAGKVAAFIKAK
jgi:oxygen-dependent protoporphyrinogen oxidase